MTVGEPEDLVVSTPPPFGALFTGAPAPGEYGSGGCLSNETNCTGTTTAEFDSNWQSYFVYDDTSMTITANDSCRTVSCRPDSACVFTLGDNGITEISFDFAISGPCHSEEFGTDWMAFWMFSDPWKGSAEVDFLEACSGPIPGGLNSNFDGRGDQVGIYEQSDPDWHGTITATFSGSGSDVFAQVTNSVNNETASSTLSRDSGYYFVLDTSPTNADGCTFTISNLSMKGSVGESGKGCAGLVQN